MKGRKAITRSKQTFRVKYPSRKNKSTVHCESLLEADAASFLEISPHVKRYAAQPGLVTYYAEDGEPLRYYPDFRVVLQDESEVDIEVKPKARLDSPRIRRKLELLVRRYADLGRRFRVLTDEYLRAEPLRSNLQLISRHSRHIVSKSKLQSLRLRAQRATFETFSEASLALGGEPSVYQLLRDGHLAINLNAPINADSRIWIRHVGENNDPLCI